MSFLNSKTKQDETWMSVSDLMAGLMMVFILIVVFYSQTVEEAARRTTGLVKQWQNLEDNIHSALEREFRADLPKWQAEIDRETLSIRFMAPEILFPPNQAELQPVFKEILYDFMPRYIEILEGRFADDIDEVRIEGHTSSEFGRLPQKEAFIANMELSQRRTRKVLEFSMSLSSLQNSHPWMIKKLSANGLSSSRLILANGLEDRVRSRRVEFTVRTKSRDQLNRIIVEGMKPVNK